MTFLKLSWFYPFPSDELNGCSACLEVKNGVDIDLVNHNGKADVTPWQPDTWESRPWSSFSLIPPSPLTLFIPLSNAFYAAQLPLHRPNVDTVMTFWLSVCKWEMKWVCDAVPGEEWNGEKLFKNGSCGRGEWVEAGEREGWEYHSGDHWQDYKKRKHFETSCKCMKLHFRI